MIPSHVLAGSEEMQATALSANLQEEIRHRAYELYDKRGRVDGRDMEDWLQAESEVTERTRELAFLSQRVVARTHFTARE